MYGVFGGAVLEVDVPGTSKTDEDVECYIPKC